MNEREVTIVVALEKCPFCGKDMQGGTHGHPLDPPEYWYHCGSCGAGEDGSFPDSLVDNDDGEEAEIWVIASSDIKGLTAPYRAMAEDALRDQIEAEEAL